MKIDIFDYGMNGEGVGKINGKVVLTNNAIVGETCEVQITHDYPNYAQAKMLQILKPSKNRDIPFCEYFNNCGGCALQHVKYAEQLKFKTLLVQKTLKKICGLEIDVEDCVPCSSPFKYRNKMSFSVCETKVGLNEKNSRDVVNIFSCPLAHPEINKVKSLFTSWLETSMVKGIKNLVVRHLNNQTLIGIVAFEHNNYDSFVQLLKNEINNFGLYEIINKRKDSVVLSGKVFHIFGLKNIQIVDFELSYTVDLLGFHQINTEIQNKIYNCVLNFISENDVVINGFSGQGLLSAAISKKAKRVIGIEINPSSHKSAQDLTRKNNIKNLTNICGDFFRELKKYNSNANTLVLDPTKKGCGKRVMQDVCGIENIIYISCNPIALAKDLNTLKNEYNIEKVIPFDMFPQTNSVETLVKLKIKEK